jgi:hypothetical protein
MKKLYIQVGGPSVAGRILKSLAIVTSVLCAIPALHAAAISVGPSGSAVITFGAIADTNGWTGANRLPNSGTAVNNGTELDAAVQTNTSPNIAATATSSPVNAAVTQQTGNPPGTSGTPRWNSDVGAMVTRPTGDAYNLLMAQFQNDSGGCVNAITITFDMNTYSAATAELPGWHVYYSLSGAAGSWQLIPSLSDVVTVGTLTANVALSGLWDAGNSLYLLWADDNGNGVSDPSYTIDNLSLGITPCNITCVGITNQSGTITVGERAAATFSIMATGSPQNVQWYRQDGGGGFNAIAGATFSTYTIASVVYPGDNGAQFYATVSNSQCNVSSTPVTLTVLPDTNSPTLIRAIGLLDPAYILLSFSEPLDPDVIDTGSFFLYESTFMGDPTTSPYNTYAATLTNQTNILLQTDVRDLSKNYHIYVGFVQDNSFNHNPLDPIPTTNGVRQTLPLIGFDVNNEWKYSTETNLFGTGWETVGYDDTGATWLSGPAGLGVDASVNGVPIRTTTAYAAHSEPQFFRRHFNFPASTNGAILSMRHVFEDGAVVFINGQEAGRYNVAAAAVLSVTTRAAANQADPTPISGPVPIPLTNVYPGDNVIAVVVIQSGATSSDCELAIELIAEVGTILSGPPVITGLSRNAANPVNEGQNLTFTVVAEGAVPLTYQWFKGPNPIAGATLSSYTIPSVAPGDAGTYSVQVDNSLGTASTNTTLTVTADTTPPYIISAIGSTNQTTVVVTLTDPQPGTGVSLATASNASNYQIVGPGGLTAISATAATSGASNVVVTLTLSGPLTQGQNYTLVVNGVTDRASTPNPVTPNSAPIVQTIVFFGFNSTWRYDQSGLDLGTAWKESGYDDSAWPSGPGVLGFETSAGTLTLFTNIAGGSGTNTVLTLTNNNGGGVPTGTNFINVTFYFRTTVNVPFDPNAPGNSLVARAYIDDGAILYVNGAERLRFNQTNGPGYTNFANGALTETSQTFITSNLTGFAQGNNVVAVEVHQDALGSSDLDWALELQGLVTTFGPEPPRVHVSRDAGTGQVTISWTDLACSLQETTALQSSGTSWGPSSVQNGVAFTPSGLMKFYRLNCP